METQTTDLKALRALFLIDTLFHYNNNNRGVGERGSKCCVYTPTEHSEGCAIGRKIPDKELLKTIINAVVDSELVYPNLPENLKQLGTDFLRSVQSLHDTADNWNETGFNLQELIELQDIEENYGLEYTIETQGETKALQALYLLDTMLHYNSDNRAENDKKCVYSPIDNISKGCAIGRKIPVEIANDIDSKGVCSVYGDIVTSVLPQSMKELYINFLGCLQDLHDCEGHWNNNGISDRGFTYAKAIAENFNLTF